MTIVEESLSIDKDGTLLLPPPPPACLPLVHVLVLAKKELIWWLYYPELHCTKTILLAKPFSPFLFIYFTLEARLVPQVKPLFFLITHTTALFTPSSMIYITFFSFLFMNNNVYVHCPHPPHSNHLCSCRVFSWCCVVKYKYELIMYDPGQEEGLT